MGLFEPDPDLCLAEAVEVSDSDSARVRAQTIRKVSILRMSYIMSLKDRLFKGAKLLYNVTGDLLFMEPLLVRRAPLA